MSENPDINLQTFENPAKNRDYLIRIETQEFTCLCPLTGQPDFATIKIEYMPDQLCLELKSLKNYFWSFRDHGAFHEKVSNEILRHLCVAIAPRFMRLTAKFNVRGGLHTTVIVEHQAPNWQPPAKTPLP